MSLKAMIYAHLQTLLNVVEDSPIIKLAWGAVDDLSKAEDILEEVLQLDREMLGDKTRYARALSFGTAVSDFFKRFRFTPPKGPLPTASIDGLVDLADDIGTIGQKISQSVYKTPPKLATKVFIIDETTPSVSVPYAKLSTQQQIWHQLGPLQDQIPGLPPPQVKMATVFTLSEATEEAIEQAGRTISKHIRQDLDGAVDQAARSAGSQVLPVAGEVLEDALAVGKHLTGAYPKLTAELAEEGLGQFGRSGALGGKTPPGQTGPAITEELLHTSGAGSSGLKSPPLQVSAT